MREKKLSYMVPKKPTYEADLQMELRMGAPQNDSEVMLSPNAVAAFGAQMETMYFALHTPAGNKRLHNIWSLVIQRIKDIMINQTYLVGVYMTQTAFASIMENNGITD